MPDGALPEPMAMMADILSQANPRAAMLMQLLQAQKSLPVDSGHLELEERLAAAENELASTTDQLRRYEAAYADARSRLDDLAAALGACGLCWGEDSRCPGCHGRGRIGFMRPDLATRARLLGQSRPAPRPAENTSRH